MRAVRVPMCVPRLHWTAPEAHKPIHIDGMAAAVEPPGMEWHKSKGKMKDVRWMRTRTRMLLDDGGEQIHLRNNGGWR